MEFPPFSFNLLTSVEKFCCDLRLLKVILDVNGLNTVFYGWKECIFKPDYKEGMGKWGMESYSVVPANFPAKI
jgi:hypothetical protein